MKLSRRLMMESVWLKVRLLLWKQQSADKLNHRCFITVRLMCVVFCVRCSINNPTNVVGSIHCLS